MDIDDIKQHWRQLDLPPADNGQPLHLAVTWTHPALRGLQRQLIFEGFCWIALLVLSYTGLDGDQRPQSWMVALAGGLLLLIGHALLGYRLATRPVGSQSLTAGLEDQIQALRKFSWLSMGLRSATLLLLFGFLTTGITDWSASHRTWAIVMIAVWTALALIVQYRMWQGRLRRLHVALDELRS